MAIRSRLRPRTLIKLGILLVVMASNSAEVTAQDFSEAFSPTPSFVVQLNLEQLLSRYPEILEIDRSIHSEEFNKRRIWLSETIKKVTIFHEVPDPENWTMPLDNPACEVVYTFEDIDAAKAFVSRERVTGTVDPPIEMKHNFESITDRNGELWVMSSSMSSPWLLHTHSNWPEGFEARTTLERNPVRQRFDQLANSPATLIVVTDAARAKFYTDGSILGFISCHLFGSFVLKDTYDNICGFELLLRLDDPAEFRVAITMKDEESAKAASNRFSSTKEFAGPPSYRQVLERLQSNHEVAISGRKVQVVSRDEALIEAVCDCLVYNLGFKYEDSTLPIR